MLFEILFSGSLEQPRHQSTAVLAGSRCVVLCLDAVLTHIVE